MRNASSPSVTRSGFAGVSGGALALGCTSSRAPSAVAALRDRDPRPFHAQVIGPEVVEGLLRTLSEERDALKLSDRVTFAGKVAAEAMYEAVRTADLGLWPAEYESFGISVVETMAAGLVPVLQDNRAFRYFVEGPTGVVRTERFTFGPNSLFVYTRVVADDASVTIEHR